MLGECVALLARDSRFGRMSLSDLEWAVLPALVNGQYMMMRGSMRRPKEGGPPVATNTAIPLGLALWAKVSDEVSEKLAGQLRANAGYQLGPGEWRNGENIWVLALVCPPSATAALRRQLELRFEGRPVHYFTVAVEGDG